MNWQPTLEMLMCNCDIIWLFDLPCKFVLNNIVLMKIKVRNRQLKLFIPVICLLSFALSFLAFLCVSLLAPKELYTWYCPMTIRPLFENTPVLDNNLNINALMTLTMMNKITRNVKWHKISNGTKCQMTQNVKWHKVSNDTKCQMTQNIKWHKMSNDTKFQMTRNDTWHMTYDTWQMTNKTWQMTHETKFQIAHYTHDTWHMRYDVWCMTHDAWWSMTPDRNTRRHTLRSVHSSPGRSFFQFQYRRVQNDCVKSTSNCVTFLQICNRSPPPPAKLKLCLENRKNCCKIFANVLTSAFSDNIFFHPSHSLKFHFFNLSDIYKDEI